MLRRTPLLIIALVLVAGPLTACAGDDPLPAAGAGDDGAGDDATGADGAGDDGTGAEGSAGDPAGGAEVPAVPDQLPEGAADRTGESEVLVLSQDNAFVDRYVVVTAGTTITWRNDGQNRHNVTPAVEGAFEAIPTDDFDPDESGSRTFDEPGEYVYYCTIHGTPTRGQNGSIIVVEA